jgi:acetyl esterase/lipase
VQASLMTGVPFEREVEVEPAALAGVPCVWHTPRDRRPERTIIYFHGGGFVMGSVAGHRDLLARLALGAEARVLGVGYRLAPEHPFPAAQDDCLAATQALLAAGADPSRVALAGDSAGGSLVVATLCALRDAGGPRVAAAALICPWTEPFASGGSMDAHAAFDFGDRALLAGWAEATLGSGDASDPRFTLANADLDGLPPLLVQVGSVELLYDQVLRFAEGARKAGVDVSLEVLSEAFHDVHIQAALLPEGAAAIQAVADYLRSRS